MFVIVIVVDTVKTSPENFNRDPIEVIVEQIEIKFVNKVLADVGLCISFYDFVEIGDPYVYPGEGAAHQRVKFRMVVFRPFVGEIIVGKLIGSNKDGLKVSIEFFDDIFIPNYLLQSPSEYLDSKGFWVWQYDQESEGQFIYERNENIRFRVRTINFTKVVTNAKGTQALTTTETKAEANNSNPSQISSSLNPLHKSGLLSSSGSEMTASAMLDGTEPPAVRRRSSSVGILENDELPPVMQIIGSVNEDGLGCTGWWTT